MPATDPLAAYRALPAETDPEAYWIVAAVRLPGWADAPGGGEARAHAALVLTRDHGIDMSAIVAGRDAAAALLVPTLARRAAKAGVRPAKIVTDRAETTAHLVAALGDLVEIRTSAEPLPALEAIKRQLASLPGAPKGVPGVLSGKGVTLEHVRAFAKAGADFYRAAPWRHLDDHDLIRVAAPRSAGGQKYVVVMGAMGQTFGLAFYGSIERYNLTMAGTGDGSEFLQDSTTMFSVTFNAANEIAFEDHDLWEDHGLPLATPDAYPFAGLFPMTSEEVLRPDAALLDHATALLGALAATTEAEMDAGEWKRTVATSSGDVEYSLTIPSLLKPEPKAAKSGVASPQAMRRVMERSMADIARMVQESGLKDPAEINRLLANRPLPEHVATTDAERADELLDQAMEVGGRRQIQLARQALALDPENADAIDILARRAGDPQARIDLYKQAVDAGRRKIGEKFDSYAGHFWGVHETRPYMRARVGLAMAYRAAGRHRESLDEFMAVIELNPHDNQGVRDLVPAAMFALGKDAEALAFAKEWQRDSAILTYAAALAQFRLTGPSVGARQLLADALSVNRHVPRQLLRRGDASGAESDGTYSPGDEREAAYCVDEIGPAWRATPGALQWVANSVPPPKARKAGPRKRRR